MYYNLVWLRPGSYLNYNISPLNYQKLIMCYTLVVTPPLLGCVGCVGYSICNMFPLITCMHPSCMYPILAQACVRMCLCLFLHIAPHGTQNMPSNVAFGVPLIAFGPIFVYLWGATHPKAVLAGANSPEQLTLGSFWTRLLARMGSEQILS